MFPIIRFIGLTILMFVAQILAFPLVPIAVALADGSGRLPKWLRWLETHDALGWGAGTYEPAIKKIYDKYGKRIALIVWLWRNRAYTLRQQFRYTPDYATMQQDSFGIDVPPKWGFFHWYGKLTDKNGSVFEYMPGVGLGKFHLYSRIGWKLKPYFKGERPDGMGATGMFIGISLRSDDWDDFPPGSV